MGRRTTEITITAEGRDHGRKYLITEMAALDAEWWAYRVLNGLAVAKVDIGAITPLMGMAGLSQALASLGILALDALFRMPPDLAKPLLDEMLPCIQIVSPGPRALNLPMGDIEEVSTLVHLREEVVSLHLGFSLRERVLAIYRQFQTATDPSSSTTPTSPEPSEPSSLPEKPA